MRAISVFLAEIFLSFKYDFSQTFQSKTANLYIVIGLLPSLTLFFPKHAFPKHAFPKSLHHKILASSSNLTKPIWNTSRGNYRNWYL